MTDVKSADSTVQHTATPNNRPSDRWFLFTLIDWLFLSREAFKKNQILNTELNHPSGGSLFHTVSHLSDLWQENIYLHILPGFFSSITNQTHTHIQTSADSGVRRGNAMYIVALFHNKRRKNIFFGLLMLCGDTWFNFKASFFYLMRWSLALFTLTQLLPSFHHYSLLSFCFYSDITAPFLPLPAEIPVSSPFNILIPLFTFLPPPTFIDYFLPGNSRTNQTSQDH